MTSRSARRSAAAALLALAAACGGEPAAPGDPVAVGSVLVAPDSVTVETNQAAQFSATTKDGAGFPVSGRTITWTSSDPARAPVTGGAVTPSQTGRYTITATSEGESDAAILNVIAPPRNDYSVADAQLTQGVQAADGSLPMVLGGNAVVVNVLVRAGTTTDRKLQVVFRLLDGAGTVVRSDTVLTFSTLSASVTYGAPSAQLLIPASAIAPGLRWQVELDPRGVATDDSLANNVFPRDAPRALAVTAVPPLKLRFVPVVLGAHSNHSAVVLPGHLPEYLRTLQSVHPVGSVSATIGAPFTTSASFGVAPSGGAYQFWAQLLSDLDLARVADGDPQTHWVGLVLPPAGFNFAQVGGIAYLPFSGAATGPGSRTAAHVQLGWFNDVAQARDGVAHELGHNFGREHAPCGGAPSGDPLYPFADGSIGAFGHDVNGWANGRVTRAVPVDPLTGDVMGYCSPVWASEYTYRGVLAFRAAGAATAPAPAARTRVLVVRGLVTDGAVALAPVFALAGRPTRPAREGAHALVGRDGRGRVLFRHSFDPDVLDHTARIRPFTFALPLDGETEARLASIEVAGPAGSARVERPGAAVAVEAGAASARRTGETAEVACGGAAARGIAVLDRATGAVLGTAAGAAVGLPVAAGAALTVLCSDGLRTAATLLVAP